MKPGESLLVLGAAGGVGLAAVELGKAMGARVIAAASSRRRSTSRSRAAPTAASSIPPGPFDRDGQKALAEPVQAGLRPGRRGRGL